MKIRSRLLQFPLFVVLTLGLVACGGGPAKQQAENPPRSISFTDADVEALYKNNCLSCHGEELRGRMGPNLQQVGAKLSLDEIRDIIREGKRGMPPFQKKLDEQQIESLAKWLAGLT